MDITKLRPDSVLVPANFEIFLSKFAEIVASKALTDEEIIELFSLSGSNSMDIDFIAQFLDRPPMASPIPRPPVLNKQGSIQGKLDTVRTWLVLVVRREMNDHE